MRKTKRVISAKAVAALRTYADLKSIDVLDLKRDPENLKMIYLELEKSGYAWRVQTLDWVVRRNAPDPRAITMIVGVLSNEAAVYLLTEGLQAIGYPPLNMVVRNDMDVPGLTLITFTVQQ